MPIVAIILGIIMVDLGFRGTEHEFAQQLGKDLSGGHFLAWFASITIIGSIGYYSPAKTVSNLMLLLIILGLTLSQKGIYANFSQLFTNPPEPAPSVPLPQVSSSSDSGGSGGGSGGIMSDFSTIESLGALAALL